MIKLQSFIVFKLKSKRLKDSKYNLNLTLDESRLNNEAVRIGDSELLRALRRIKGVEFSQDKLNSLISQRDKIKRKPNTEENKKRLSEINSEIDDILFIPEIVNVTFDDTRHYQNIVKIGGFKLNGKKYVRLLTGAGMARRSTVMFIEESMFQPMDEIIQNGRNKNIKLNPAKWNAYYALVSSATTPVRTPKFVVVNDYETNKKIKVDYLIEYDDKDHDFEEREIDNLFNRFDGQGLISSRQSYRWRWDLELDWTPCAWIIRGSFLKGLLVEFDFHSLAKEHGITKIKDVYGNEHDIDDIDVIVTTSQFKLWNAYTSIDDYVSNCEKNGLGWGVSRYTPKEEKTHAFTSYQYIQNLNIATDEEIETLCEDTVNWISDISSDDWEKSLLYLLGETNRQEVDERWFNGIDVIAKILMLKPEFSSTLVFQNHIRKMIRKRIRESYMGSLIIDGNYQFMISDPYAQAESALGLPVRGLLEEFEYFSQWWNEKDVSEVAAIRSPLTWRSEVMKLKLSSNDKLSKWFGNLYSGIVFNAFGDDFLRMSGADSDGDICLTTSSKTIVGTVYKDTIPPAYNRQTAGKSLVDYDTLWEADCKTFKGKIGLITNIGTNFMSMLPLYDESSLEYKLLINRIKSCNTYQSMEIDKAKGIQTIPIPKWWTTWIKDDNENKDIYNSIICDKRPYYFRYLYPDYNKDFLKHQSKFNNYAMSKFGKTIEEIKNSTELTEHEEKILSNYHKYSPLLDTPCLMNKISHHMEKTVKEIRRNSKTIPISKVFNLSEKVDQKLFSEIKSIYDKYYARVEKSEADYTAIRNKCFELTNNFEEIFACSAKISESFTLGIFAYDILDYLIGSAFYANVPVLSDNGSIEYLGKTYVIEKVKVDKLWRE